ncbi:MmpS family transport accessory protein [Micromonospora sp. NPDC048930]|uniref:MmpS family transport accessory protein n=1 Tax=Micromonospora sp. NPDC048930 TaxID=3364261 RepID=UPI003721E247
MSEATPPPEPPAGSGPTDPTAPPAPEPWTPPAPPAPWTPPDPLAAPQPWAPPTPWSPPDTSSGSGTPLAPGLPDSSPFPAGHPVPAGSYFPADRPGTPPTADPADPTGAPRPTDQAGDAAPAPVAAPRPATPPVGALPGHPWPGYAPSSWPPPGYPPSYAYPGARPPRTGRGLAIVLVAVGTALVLALCGCLGLGVLGSLVDDPADSYEGSAGSWPTEPYEPDESAGTDSGLVTAAPTRSPAVTPSGGVGRHTVVYEVTGSTLADLEYYDANGDFVQTERVRLPWRLRLTADGTDRVMMLVRHADDTESSPLGCRIVVDGKVVAQETTEYGADCYG